MLVLFQREPVLRFELGVFPVEVGHWGHQLNGCSLELPEVEAAPAGQRELPGADFACNDGIAAALHYRLAALRPRPSSPVPASASATLSKNAHADAAKYKAMYARSIADPEGFWGDMAQDFEWMAPWTRVKNTSFVDDVSIRWYEDAKLNITVNCVDRHAKAQPDKTAIIWEGDTPGEIRTLSYRELLAEVNQAANALKARGVKKGDRVTIYMPMVPEAAVAMLATARIGAIHSVVFGGFSADSIRGRVVDCASDFIITANVGRRGGKTIPLKANVDAAIEGLNMRHVLVLQTVQADAPFTAGRDVWWHDVVPSQSTVCAPEVMDADAVQHPVPSIRDS